HLRAEAHDQQRRRIRRRAEGLVAQGYPSTNVTELLIHDLATLAGRIGVGSIAMATSSETTTRAGAPAHDDELRRLSIDTIRALSMDAVQKANAGHPGTAMAL